MKKLTIEIQYDEGSGVPEHLREAVYAAEFARLTGDYSFTVIRGETQIPKDALRHREAVIASKAKSGGCW